MYLEKEYIYLQVNKLKDTFLLISILLFVLLMDIIRVEFKIPVSLLDIIFFPVLIVLSFLLIRVFVSKKSAKHYIDKTTTKNSLVTFLIVTLIVVPLSCWAIWSGVSVPFEYFSGVKGSAHGYTLTALGIFLLIFWGVFSWDIYLKMTYKKTHKK